MSEIRGVRRKGRLPRRGVILGAALLLLSACAQVPPPGAGTAPASGTLTLESAPTGARVGLDGRQTGLSTPAEVTGVSPGEHLVSFSMRGYRLWEQPVVVHPGETLNLDVRLEPIATGSLSVSSIPFMSLIFIDGRPTPFLTPATLTNLPVGTHTVLLRREGYEDWSQAVVVMENRQMTLKASLKPAQGLRGNLDIRTTPPLADIFVDGYPTGNRTPATIFNLLAGRHLVELRKDGHQTWREEVTVPEGVTWNLLVTLRPTEARLTGSALISSMPAGAEVVLDEVRVSKRTPVRFETIAHGTHAVVVRKDGYLPWEGELEVRPGEKTELAVTLRPGE